MAIVEGTWTTPQKDAPVAPALYGTRGMMRCEKRGADFVIQITELTGETREIVADSPDGNLTDTASAYVAACETGGRVHATLGPDLNLQAMAILDAGIRSAATGLLEPAGNAAWPGIRRNPYE
jgi:hypothetical protein